MAHNGVCHFGPVCLIREYTPKNSPRNAACMQCEVEHLSSLENCANEASYAITISYLGHPALALHLCKVHILDTWHLAQRGAIPLFGNDGHVKSVAVKKL